MYDLEQGSVERTILKQVLRERLPVPKRIQNAPRLRFGLELYYGAFFDLCSCRLNAWDFGEIPWTATNEYCRTLGLDEDQTEKMHYFIALLDRTYLRIMRKKRDS